MSRAGATRVSAVRCFVEPFAAVGAIAPPGESVGEGREDEFGFVSKGPGRIDDEEAAAVEARWIVRALHHQLKPHRRARNDFAKAQGYMVNLMQVFDRVPS